MIFRYFDTSCVNGLYSFMELHWSSFFYVDMLMKLFACAELYVIENRGNPQMTSLTAHSHGVGCPYFL